MAAFFFINLLYFTYFFAGVKKSIHTSKKVGHDVFKRENPKLREGGANNTKRNLETFSDVVVRKTLNGAKNKRLKNEDFQGIRRRRL